MLSFHPWYFEWSKTGNYFESRRANEKQMTQLRWNGKREARQKELHQQFAFTNQEKNIIPTPNSPSAPPPPISRAAFRRVWRLLSPKLKNFPRFHFRQKHVHHKTRVRMKLMFVSDITKFPEFVALIPCFLCLEVVMFVCGALQLDEECIGASDIQCSCLPPVFMNTCCESGSPVDCKSCVRTNTLQRLHGLRLVHLLSDSTNDLTGVSAIKRLQMGNACLMQVARTPSRFAHTCGCAKGSAVWTAFLFLLCFFVSQTVRSV